MEKSQRVWGYYEILYSDIYCKIKFLFIDVEKNISYQYHRKREEHWTIAQGYGKVILDNNVILLKKGDKIKIDKYQKHMIKNIGKEKLIIHEVQLGESFEETDIVRELLPIDI